MNDMSISQTDDFIGSSNRDEFQIWHLLSQLNLIDVTDALIEGSNANKITGRSTKVFSLV